MYHTLISDEVHLKGTKIISFGCTFDQYVLITETDRILTQNEVPNYQVTIFFCDFVAVWHHAIKKDDDLIGDVFFCDCEVGKENHGLIEYLESCGYTEVSILLREYIKTFLM